MIATGGTIASRPTENGLSPQLSTDEILSFVPEIKDIAEVSAVQLFNIDSTNLYWKHWLKIADCIKSNYETFDGFVITHGTDTMAYTASAISYLVQNSRKPIVFTGSQKSIYMRDTDARNNLYDAFVYAVDDAACLVHVVFENKIIIATRARKTRTKSYNAFSSVDFPEVGIVRDGKVLTYVPESASSDAPVFYDKLNPRVFVLKLIPGEKLLILPELEKYYDAIVIESFGVGNVPLYDNDDFVSAVNAWISHGKTIVITTQVPHEGCDMGLYETGNILKHSRGVIEAYNMTLEAVVTKLMWILGITSEPSEIRKLFHAAVQKDII